jgi:hypothetical protein
MSCPPIVLNYKSNLQTVTILSPWLARNLDG